MSVNNVKLYGSLFMMNTEDQVTDYEKTEPKKKTTNVRKGIIHRMSNEGLPFNLNSFFIQLKLIMGKERKDSV